MSMTVLSFFSISIICRIKFKYRILELYLLGHSMGTEISEREVLNSLSLSQLRKLAKTFDIDTKPKLSEMPLFTLRGEKHFIADKIYEVIGITVEDIDKVLGTNFLRTQTQTADTWDADFRVTLLDKFVDEDDLDIYLLDLNLSVSGSKVAQIKRLIDSGQMEVPDILKKMDAEVLVRVCESLGLEITGTEDELKNRILTQQGFEVQV